MAEDRLDSFADIPALKAEGDIIIGLLDEINKKFEGINNMKISLEGLTKTKEVIQGAQEAATAMTDLAAKVDVVKKADVQYVAAAKEAVAANAAQAKSNQTLGSTFDELIKLQVENNQSLKQLRAARKALDDQYKNDKGNATYIQALEQIRKSELAAQVANNDLSRSLRNLEKEAQASGGSLNEMRAQLNLTLQAYDALSDVDRSGDIGKGLKSNIDALTESISKEEQATGRFQRNVGNYSGSISILEGALQDVRQKLDEYSKSGKASSDVIAQLAKEEGLLANLVQSQTAGFASATQEVRNNEAALQALAAAGLKNTEFYQALLKETAELKDNVGDLKAEIKNLASDTSTLDGLVQGAQTLAGIYGIAEGAAALFGEENEELQKTFVKLQAITTIINGLQGIQNALQKESSLMLLLNNTRTKALAITQTLYTAATGSATAATTGFKVALASTGIGLVVVAIAAAVSIMSSFSSETEKATKEVEGLDKALDTINESFDTFNRITDRQVRDEQARAKLRFAGDQELASLELKGLTERRKNNEERKKLLDERFANEKLSGEQIDSLSKERSGLTQDIADIDSDIAAKSLDIQKMTIEGSIKLRQAEIEQLNTHLAQKADAQNKIISDESKSFEERANAALRFALIQRDIIQNELKSQKLDPNLKNDPAKRVQIETKANDALVRNKLETELKLSALTNERISRERQAQFELTQLVVQQEADRQNAIAENENINGLDRLDGLTKYFQIQKSLIKAQTEFELQNANLLETEKEAIRQRGRNETLAQEKAFLERSYQLQLSALDKETQNAIAYANRRRDTRIIELNEQFQAGIISQEDYNRRRLALDERMALDELNVTLDFLEKELAVRKAAGEDVLNLEAAIAKARADISEKTTSKIISDEDKAFQEKKDKLLAYQQIQSNLTSAYLDVNAITADRELVRIEESIAALEKRKAAQIEYANATIASEEQKAAAILVIEARANVEREAIERKRRQVEIEQARFQKAANIARIISDTAVAVVTTLGDNTIKPGFLRVPLAVSIGAMGASQLARAIAAPLPQYGDGTTDHPGGPAVLGDKFKREFAITPAGDVFMSDNKPQIVDLPRHTVVLPDADAVMQDVRNAGLIEVSKMNLKNDTAINDALIKAFTRETKGVVNAINKKKDVQITGTHAGVTTLQKWAMRQIEYVDKNINF